MPATVEKRVCTYKADNMHSKAAKKTFRKQTTRRCHRNQPFARAQPISFTQILKTPNSIAALAFLPTDNKSTHPPSSAMNSMDTHLSAEKQDELLSLLKQKLFDIPANHLPALTLTDIIEQTPKALNIPQYAPTLIPSYSLSSNPSCQHSLRPWTPFSLDVPQHDQRR
jgi:hypothetical protein